MLKTAITLRLEQEELKSIFEALTAKADWLNTHCIPGTGDTLKDLAMAFNSAKKATISIEYH